MVSARFFSFETEDNYDEILRVYKKVEKDNEKMFFIFVEFSDVQKNSEENEMIMVYHAIVDFLPLVKII